MGKVMGEEDSRLFPLPIVHRALNIFTSVFIVGFHMTSLKFKLQNYQSY